MLLYFWPSFSLTWSLQMSKEKVLMNYKRASLQPRDLPLVPWFHPSSCCSLSWGGSTVLFHWDCNWLQYKSCSRRTLNTTSRPVTFLIHTVSELQCNISLPHCQSQQTYHGHFEFKNKNGSILLFCGWKKTDFFTWCQSYMSVELGKFFWPLISCYNKFV